MANTNIQVIIDILSRGGAVVAADVQKILKDTERQSAQTDRVIEQANKTRLREQTKAQKQAADDFIKQLKRVQSEEKETSAGFSTLGKTMLSAFASFSGNLAADVVQSLTSALIAGGKAIVDYSARMEQTKIAFTSLMGNAALATEHLEELRKFATQTPFEFESLAKMSQRLQGVGVAATEVIPLMKDIGNVVSATGEISAERVEGITTALTQMISKTKVSAEEMEQLAERGLTPWQYLSEVMGKSQAEVRKLAEQGKITSDVMVDALRKISQQKFGDAMEKQSQTFSGSMSTIKDSVLDVAYNAFKPLFDEITKFTVQYAKQLNDSKNKTGDFGQDTADILRGVIKLWKDATEAAKEYHLTQILFGAGGQYISDTASQMSWSQMLTGALGEWLRQKGQSVRPLDKTANLGGLEYRLNPETNTIEPTGNRINEPQGQPQPTGAPFDDKLAKENAQAQIAITKAIADANRQAFESLQEKEIETYKQRGITAERFRSEFLENERQFRIKMLDLIENEYSEKRAQEKNAKAIQALKLEENNAKEKLILDSQKRENEAEKLITETQKKESEERVKNAEEEANNKIALHKKYTENAIKESEERLRKETLIDVQYTEEALERMRLFGEVEAKQRYTETMHAEQVAKLKIRTLQFEKLTLSSLEQTAEIKQRIKVIDAELQAQQFENSEAYAKASKVELEQEEKKTVEMLKQLEIERERERLRQEQRLGAGQGAAGAPTPIQPEISPFEGFVDSVKDFFDLESKIPVMEQAMVGMAETIANAFSGLANALGSVVQQWVLYGNTGTAVMRKILASTLASIAAESAVRAIFELAKGFAALFLNPPEAAAHFQAAALFGSIAVGTGLAGRAVAGNAFRNETNRATGQNAATSSGRQRSGSTNLGAYSGNTETQIIEQGRNQPAGITGSLDINANVKIRDGFLGDALIIEFERNGKLRGYLREQLI